MAGLFDVVDRFYDRIDSAAETVDKFVNRHKHAQEQARSIHTTATTGQMPASRSTALVKQVRFFIDEVIDASSGQTIYVVTDGGAARCECTTRAMANKVLIALHKETP